MGTTIDGDDLTMAGRRARKYMAFVEFSSETCPGCGWPKRPFGWLCVCCEEQLKRHRPNLFDALESACSAHLGTADLSLTAARELSGRNGYEKVKK